MQVLLFGVFCMSVSYISQITLLSSESEDIID